VLIFNLGSNLVNTKFRVAVKELPKSAEKYRPDALLSSKVELIAEPK